MRKPAMWLLIAVLVAFAAAPFRCGYAQEADGVEPNAEQGADFAYAFLPETQEPLTEEAQSAPDETELLEQNPAPQTEAQPKPPALEAAADPEMTEPLPKEEEPAQEPASAPETTLTLEPSALPEEHAQGAEIEDVDGALSNLQIIIWLDGDGPYCTGDTVMLKSRIEGIQPDSVYSMQWQYFDGTQWLDELGATSDTCNITITETNAAYLWRLAVTVA